MILGRCKIFLVSLIAVTLSACQPKPHCDNSPCGPQSPRDIDKVDGINRQTFSLAPDYKAMNLCDIHFHKNAEHKAADFSIDAGSGNENGVGGGYRCEMKQDLSQSESDNGAMCNGLKSGDTIEVHWVHTSCNVKPEPGLESCLCKDEKSGKDQTLRVEAQVFTVVNDSSALDFYDMAYQSNKANGYYQARSLPGNTGEPVVYFGSTTGPSYNSKELSSLEVTWSVRPQCAMLDINKLGDWCADNIFKEYSAHGVRELVVDLDLLSPIRP